MARHLEELALFALPKSAMNDESSTEGEDDVANSNHLRHPSLDGLDNQTSDEDQEAIHESDRDSRSSECTGEVLAAEPDEEGDEGVKKARLKDKLQDTMISQDQNPDVDEHGFLIGEPPDEPPCALYGAPESSEVPPAARRSSTDRELVSNDRPYICEEHECHNLPGFTYSGGLRRHQREIHGKYGGPEALTQDGSSSDESMDQEMVRKAVFEEAVDYSTSENLYPRPNEEHLMGQARHAESIAVEEYRRRVRKDLESAGYDGKEIEKILTKKKKQPGNEEVTEEVDIRRPIYVKVHKTYLSEETLEIYDLEYEVDDVSHLIHFN